MNGDDEGFFPGLPESSLDTCFDVGSTFHNAIFWDFVRHGWDLFGVGLGAMFDILRSFSKCPGNHFPSLFD